MALQWLGRALRRASATVVMGVDPWGNSGGSYVYSFREQLDEIASALFQMGKTIRTRFNQDLQCAELYVPFGEVLARVVVHGEMCSPERAIVTLLSLPESSKDLFVKLLPLPVEFKQVA